VQWSSFVSWNEGLLERGQSVASLSVLLISTTTAAATTITAAAAAVTAITHNISRGRIITIFIATMSHGQSVAT
jgi:hypothetical protein